MNWISKKIVSAMLKQNNEKWVEENLGWVKIISH